MAVATGDLAAGVPAHAVGDGDDQLIALARRARLGQHGVLVVVANPSGVGSGCPGESHRTSMMVCPMRIASP